MTTINNTFRCLIAFVILAITSCSKEGDIFTNDRADKFIGT